MGKPVGGVPNPILHLEDPGDEHLIQLGHKGVHLDAREIRPRESVYQPQAFLLRHEGSPFASASANPVEDIRPAPKPLEPGEELSDVLPALDYGSMLGGDRLDVQGGHAVHPAAARCVGGHIALVKPLHERQDCHQR